MITKVILLFETVGMCHVSYPPIQEQTIVTNQAHLAGMTNLFKV